MKKLLAVLLALVMVLSLAACAASAPAAEEEAAPAAEEEAAPAEEEEAAPAEEEEAAPAEEEAAPAEEEAADGYANTDYASVDLTGYTFGYVTINSSAPWGGRVGTEFERMAEEVGATVEVLDANTDADLVTQYCQQFVDEGVDALVVFGGDPAAMSEMAAICNDAGIPLFLCGLDADEATAGYEYVTAMIGPDQYQMCVDIANYVVAENGEDYACNVYEINGVPFLQDYIDRNAGFEDTIANYAGYVLAGKEDCYSDRTAAKSATENWITAGLKEGDIIMGYDDDLTMGAVQALEEAGLTGKVKVYSLTGQNDAIQAVADGSLLLTVMNRADNIAAGTVTACYEYLTTGSTGRFQLCELTYITPENASEFVGKGEF